MRFIKHSDNNIYYPEVLEEYKSKLYKSEYLKNLEGVIGKPSTNK